MQRWLWQLAAIFKGGWPGAKMVPAYVTFGDGYALSGASHPSMNVESILDKFRIVLGVPKFRTAQVKKVTRKFDINRTLHPKTNLLVCSNCGGYHHPSEVCATCYDKVRTLTNYMKEKIMAYNPYLGERQSTNVRFEDDPSRSAGDQPKQYGDKVHENALWRRIVELEMPRPSWFKPKFVERPNRAVTREKS